MSAAGDGPEDEERLVEHYWRYAHEVHGADRALHLVHEARANETSRADDRVREMVDAPGPRVLPLLVRLALSAPDEDSLAFSAAGPLEDWMGRVPGEHLIGGSGGTRALG